MRSYLYVVVTNDGLELPIDQSTNVTWLANKYKTTRRTVQRQSAKSLKPRSKTQPYCFRRILIEKELSEA